MAIDPATAKMIAKVAISQIADEEKRQRLIIGIIIAIMIFLIIIMIPIFLLTSTTESIKKFFGWENDEEITDPQYVSIMEIKKEYGKSELITEELNFNGSLPMPVNDAVVTSEFGARVHPVTGSNSFHTGIDLAGIWHSNIISVLDGKVVWAGVKVGYGNCIEVKHVEGNEVFYTFYAHLARIDVIEGQEVKQGNVIGIQGGDPNRDPNPGYSTGSHLHFEIRKTVNGDFQNPRIYLFET